MEIVLAPYKDPANGLDWDQQTPVIKKEIEGLLDKYSKKLNYKLSETDHGKGADWPTITLVIYLFFTIPKFHKKIRETIAEWKLIYIEISDIIKYVADKVRILFYPKELLLLDSLIELEKNINVLELELVDIFENKEIYSGLYCPLDCKLLIFSFRSNDFIYQVGITNQRNIVFVNKIKLSE